MLPTSFDREVENPNLHNTLMRQISSSTRAPRAYSYPARALHLHYHATRTYAVSDLYLTELRDSRVHEQKVHAQCMHSASGHCQWVWLVCALAWELWLSLSTACMVTNCIGLGILSHAQSTCRLRSMLSCGPYVLLIANNYSWYTHTSQHGLLLI